MPKNVQTTAQLHSFHKLAKQYSKSFKLGFSSMWTENFQIYKLGFEEVEEPPEIKLPTSIGSWRKQGNSRKTSTSASLTMLKPLCGPQQSGKFLKRWEYQTTVPASRKTCMQIKKQQSELDMKQWIGSKLGKVYDKAVYCHPVKLTSMQSTSSQLWWITS